MVTTQMIQNKSHFVSTFLSHSSVDNDLAEQVAKRLGRRGVLTWLDKNELLEMGPLDQMLKQAVQQQATLTLVLSEASLKSEWCRDELRWAIEAQAGADHLLPVYLGNPLKLVRSHPLLRERRAPQSTGSRQRPDRAGVGRGSPLRSHHRRRPLWL